MLIAKGYRVAFKLKSGSTVRAPGALLHDPAGKSWPSDSCLVMPFTRGRASVDDADAERYFGYKPREGSLSLPPRALSSWKRVGTVAQIDYTRPGEYAGRWWHPFKDGGWIFPAVPPELYRRGRVLRLEFPGGCKLSWRGFVYP